MLQNFCATFCATFIKIYKKIMFFYDNIAKSEKNTKKAV